MKNAYLLPMSLLVAWVVAACQVSRILSVAPVLGSSWLTAGLWMDPSGTPYLVAQSEGGTALYRLSPPSSDPIALLGAWEIIIFVHPTPYPYGLLYRHTSTHGPLQSSVELARYDLKHHRIEVMGTFSLQTPSVVSNTALPPCNDRTGILVETPSERKILLIRLSAPFSGELVSADVMWNGWCHPREGVWLAYGYNPYNFLEVHQGQFDIWIRVAALSPWNGRILDAAQMARPPFTGVDLRCFTPGSCWMTIQSSPYSGPLRAELWRVRLQGPRIHLRPVWQSDRCGIVVPLGPDQWVVWEGGRWTHFPSGKRFHATPFPGEDVWCEDLFPSTIHPLTHPYQQRAVMGLAFIPFQWNPKAPPTQPRWMLAHVRADSISPLHVWPPGFRLQGPPVGSYTRGWWVFWTPHNRHVEVWQHICK